LIGGQRSRTNRASFNPSIEPGIWISVIDKVDVGLGRQDCDGFVGIRRLYDCETRILQDLDGIPAQQKFVLTIRMTGFTFGISVRTSGRPKRSGKDSFR
jgi:hypothetical protein